MKTFLKLLRRRVLQQNYIDVWYVLAISLASAGGAYVWLLGISREQIIGAVVAALYGILATLPIYGAFMLIHKQVKLTEVQTLVTSLTVILTANFAFIYVFYALSPAIYESKYLGLIYGWLNQTSAALYLFAGYSFLRGSFIDFRNVNSKYKSLVRDYSEFKSAAINRLERENQELKERARDALLPSIIEIQTELKNSNQKFLVVAEKIQDTLKNKVKPLGYDLRTVFGEDKLESRIQQQKIKPWGSVPMRINPKNTYSATFTALFSLPVAVPASFALTSKTTLWVIVVEIIITWLVLLAGQSLLPNRKINSMIAFAMQFVMTYIAIRIAGLAGAQIMPSENNPTTFVYQMGFLIMIAGVAYTYVGVTEISLDNSKRGIQKVENSFENSRELLAQKVWIAKRNWSYLVHGSVQAHLLAARAIALRGNLDDEKISKIKRHFEDLLEILNNPPRPDVDLLQEIADLEATWSGVCELNFNFAPGALIELDKNANMRFALNEITKEAVSNAVKHSKANVITFDVSLDGQDLIFKAENNGIEPVVEARKSLGSEMFDELTKDWSLSFNHDSQLVVLNARLALA